MPAPKPLEVKASSGERGASPGHRQQRAATSALNAARTLSREGLLDQRAGSDAPPGAVRRARAAKGQANHRTSSTARPASAAAAPKRAEPAIRSNTT